MFLLCFITHYVRDVGVAGCLDRNAARAHGRVRWRFSRFPEQASIRLPWHTRFRKPPLSSRPVGFPKSRLATMTFPADLPVRAQVKVLTNIHPSPRRFVSLLGTYIQNICPAQSPECMDTFPAPVMTESSFASSRCYLSERSVPRYVGWHYPALIAPRTHAPDLHALRPFVCG
jgi:hypothetical protein